ncbi:class I SAM-dependent methyltransferase [Fuerstiella marisgermanici]|uniref:Methyltransferase domain protein n=1 Tax=Fuerstiella marisgermanici TaxID=1891926 RepID=A0A1P8WM17_9PLAN|nr:class I SAM-dependent methyltransferase [Fuerstiella marisgermanici]APZ95102.1 Methyltransferase domain protein [Fuerstiella marisgermanici]
MQASHLQELVDLEDSYWWHVAKRQLVTRLLNKYAPAPGRLVEGGIGSGRNLIEFRDMGYDVSGFDLMPESVAHVRQRGIEDVHVHDLGQPWPVAEKSLKAVVLLDVLEHVEHPVEVLGHVKKALADDGAVIITVPAYPWLFSRWDEQLGHFRRYTTREFRRHAAEAGFRVNWLNHWNSFTLPAAMAVRGVEKVFPKREHPDFPKVSRFTNNALLTAAAAERWCMGKLPVPAGLSLAGVLTK